MLLLEPCGISMHFYGFLTSEPEKYDKQTVVYTSKTLTSLRKIMLPKLQPLTTTKRLSFLGRHIFIFLQVGFVWQLTLQVFASIFWWVQTTPSHVQQRAYFESCQLSEGLIWLRWCEILWNLHLLSPCCLLLSCVIGLPVCLHFSIQSPQLAMCIPQQWRLHPFELWPLWPTNRKTRTSSNMTCAQ